MMRTVFNNAFVCILGCMIITGCSVKIDTTSLIPETNNQEISQKNEEIQKLQDQNALLEEKLNKLEKLEKEIDSLNENQSEADLLTTLKSIATEFSLLKDDKGFRFVAPNESKVSIGILVAWEAGKGTGFLAMDEEGNLVDLFRSSWSDECPGLYTSRVVQEEFRGYPAYFYNDLCTGSDHTPFLITFTEINDTETNLKIVVSETVPLEVENQQAVETFYDAFDGVRANNF